jgi:hypothetical protein
LPVGGRASRRGCRGTVLASLPELEVADGLAGDDLDCGALLAAVGLPRPLAKLALDREVVALLQLASEDLLGEVAEDDEVDEADASVVLGLRVVGLNRNRVVEDLGAGIGDLQLGITHEASRKHDTVHCGHCYLLSPRCLAGRRCVAVFSDSFRSEPGLTRLSVSFFILPLSLCRLGFRVLGGNVHGPTCTGSRLETGVQGLTWCGASRRG